MVGKAVFILLVAVGAYLCDGKSFKNPSLHDDIRLTPEQEQEMKERGFFTAGKWPKINGVVTVPYYFDSRFFPEGDAFRDKFRAAASVYRAHSCINWVEVNKTDDVHKVRIMKGGGCYSYVGILSGSEQEISLPEGCQSTGTMLHEMGHCMGLFHTQSRPDRDEYVKVWKGNIEKGLEDNFAKSNGDTFGIPYDYRSMMHYGNDYFSINGSFTLTTSNPYAIFTIGNRPDVFRYSDSAFLNKGYDCVADFTKTCGEKNCLNGGFVSKDCSCRCPENTSGERCETLNGPLFADTPVCGGEVTTEQDLTPYGYPETPTADPCIFKVQAPRCKLPAFSFSEAKFFYRGCAGNILALELSNVSFGYTWCEQSKVPLGVTFVSETQRAILYYRSYSDRIPTYGFRARLTFVDDPACGPVSSTTTTSTTTTVTTTTTKTTTKTTTTTTKATASTGSTLPTTKPPITQCTLTEVSTSNFQYKTANFPNAVAPGSTCSFSRSPTTINDLIFMKVEVDFRGSPPDVVEFGDGRAVTSYSYSTNLTEYLVWPMTFKYTASSATAKGFSMIAKPVSGLASPCNGEQITLAAGEARNISNPLVGTKGYEIRCAFRVTAPVGKKIRINPVVNTVKQQERLLVSAYLPSYESYVNIGKISMTSWGNNVKVLYAGYFKYYAWTLEFKVV